MKPNSYLFVIYIKELYRKRTLFILLSVFIFLNIGFTLSGIEAAPFFHYSMYSGHSPETDIVYIYTVECDDIPFNEPEIWNHHRRIMFNYTAEFYDKSLQNDSMPIDRVAMEELLRSKGMEEEELIDDIYAGKEDIRAYPFWLKQYLSKLLNRDIHKMEVFKTTAIYQSDGKLIPIDKITLCKS